MIFFDGVATPHTPVYLKVFTKGILFPQGGRRVDIYLENKKIGNILSGGDGYGYLKYTPKNPGISTLVARLNDDSDQATLLVIKKTEKAILFEIEEGLVQTIFSQKAGSVVQNALKTLAKKFRIIYLTSVVGYTAAKKIIATKNFPTSAVLAWQGTDTFVDLKNRHIIMAAIIASSAILSDASDYVEKRFTFTETEDDRFAEDWQDILKRLQ